MQNRMRRRDFLLGTGAAAAATVVPSFAWESLRAAELLYPHVDLSYFDTPISPAPGEIHFGYASITWNGNDRQAIEDIAALGFPGIQLRANAIKEFTSPAALRDLLEKHHLKMVALSSGGVRIEPAVEAEEITKHTDHAQFVHDAGGLYLQVTDERPKDRAVTPADYERLGKLITKIGQRTADLGVSLGYHNHMGTIGEKPDDVDRILDAADPRYVKLELDVAHYHQGGGDPVRAIRRYAERLLFLHLKDVEPTAGGQQPYRFVELGRGKVNLTGVLEALKDVKFRGWLIVELDAVPDKARTPKESALIAKHYLEEHGYLHTLGTH